MQSSEFAAKLDQVPFNSEKPQCAFVLTCVQVDCKGRGGPPAHTWHFLDLWYPRSQHTLFGVPLYFRYIQLTTSRALWRGKVLFKVFLRDSKNVNPNLLFPFFRDSLSSCFTAS